MSLPEPECRGGYTHPQIVEIVGQDREQQFWNWMTGQTMMVCDGRRYNHDTQEYEQSCEVAHGMPIVYPWDLERFLDGRPIID